jgi:hypothetical protein
MKAKDLKKGDFFRFGGHYADYGHDTTYLVTEEYSNRITFINPMTGEAKHCSNMEQLVEALDVKLQVSRRTTLKDLAPGDVFRTSDYGVGRFVKLGGADAGFVAEICLADRVCIHENVRVERTSLVED